MTTPSIIGQPATRQDAKLKVTGAAKYAAEFALPDMAYAVLVTSAVGRGTITNLDVSAARAATGVLAVISHLDEPRLRALDPKAMARRQSPDRRGACLPFQSADIVYNGQAIAVVDRRYLRARALRRDFGRKPTYEALCRLRRRCATRPISTRPKSAHGSPAQVDARHARCDLCRARRTKSRRPITRPTSITIPSSRTPRSRIFTTADSPCIRRRRARRRRRRRWLIYSS